MLVTTRFHLQGLWSAELLGTDRVSNIGVLVFQPVRATQDFYEEGRILGGDRHYVHAGTYKVENGHLVGQFRTLRYDVHEKGEPLFTRCDTHFDFEGVLEARMRRDVLDFRIGRGMPEVTGLRLTLRAAP